MSVLVLENSLHRVVLDDGLSAPEALGEIARWLAAAEAAHRKDGRCRTFSVSIHADGADCDHERPEPRKRGRHAGAS